MNYWKVKKVPESLGEFLNQSTKTKGAPPLCLGLQVIIHYKYKPKIHCFSSLVHIVLGVFFLSLVPKSIQHKSFIRDSIFVKLKIVLCLNYLHNLLLELVRVYKNVI